MTINEAWRAVDVPTMALLFALMVISAQFRLGGFYARVTRNWPRPGAPRPGSCFWSSWPPPCSRRFWPTTSSAWPWPRSWWRHAGAATSTPCPTSWDWPAPRTSGRRPRSSAIPRTCSSARSRHPLRVVLPPGRASGGGRTRGLLGRHRLLWRGRWRMEAPRLRVRGPDFNSWQSFKGCATLVFLVAVFLAGSWPREVAALFCAGVLLSSRRLTSARFFSLVDWPLLLLFMGLFVVNHAVASSGFWPACTACSNRAGWT